MLRYVHARTHACTHARAHARTDGRTDLDDIDDLCDAMVRRELVLSTEADLDRITEEVLCDGLRAWTCVCRKKNVWGGARRCLACVAAALPKLVGTAVMTGDM